ncbi:sulfite exporter TauE/SafE family protein [Paenalcaligenes niemegkensis]|uniref:sulfite exporter TauE/SafE family protein n=1 Tax=Paenalcaligenes niemegkensis TaxID=2895469 RepID=UPI001EE807F1|nr:sulfite exporter TauE/SafE family protein [Paenalcaligenes niemegkensis]MCQ9615627.1 sulfite exporter TauE/SafE family protein [Paenalcaligenes niemegkensis]
MSSLNVWLLVPVFLAVGASIGFVGGVLGIGGGLLAIPLLVLLLQMDQQMAQGTALIMVLPAVLLTIRKYNQYARIDRQAAMAGALSASAFTWLGAQLALRMPSSTLRLVYAGFVFLVALYYIHQSLKFRTQRRPKAKTAGDYPPFYFALVGVIAGVAGGVFGVGGSVLAVPFLTSFLALSQIGAQAIALTMITPGVVVALLTYASHGQVNWQVGLPMALGSIFLVPAGVRLAHGMPEPRLKLIFACMLLVIMMLLLLKV